MARVFITGSSDGLGLMAARLLIEQGHEVVVHGRNEGRSRDAVTAAAGTRGAVTGVGRLGHRLSGRILTVNARDDMPLRLRDASSPRHDLFTCRSRCLKAARRRHARTD